MEHSLQIAQHTTANSLSIQLSDLHLQNNQMAPSLPLQSIYQLQSFNQSNLGLFTSDTIIEQDQENLRFEQSEMGLNDQLDPIQLQVNSQKHQEFFNDLENILKENFQKKQNFSMKKRKCSNNHNCTICHQKVKRKSTIYRLKCKHIFHVECLDGWKSKRNNCPLCRKDLV